MKLVIIEGTDNTGKDTLISKLLEKYPTVTLIHCGKPCSKKYSSREQDELFSVYTNNIVNKIYDNTHIIIMNRSHIGEYVYGVMYRHRDIKDAEAMVMEINARLELRSDLDVRYVQLLCSSEKLISENEDGKSLSSGDMEKIKQEREMFEQIFNLTLLKKKLIYVNDGDNFRSRESIFNEVYKFIEG